MRLYSCYTPSHRPLLEQHFLPSLGIAGLPAIGARDIPATSVDSAVRVIHESKGATIAQLSQRSPTGAFDSAGFQATCLDKVDFILEALRNETEPFVFSDVDVRFYGPVVEDLLKLLGNRDMAFQWDGARGEECTGFMVLRPGLCALDFWTRVREHMVTANAMDQDAAHFVLRLLGKVQTHTEREKFGAMAVCTGRFFVLPERYWTFGRNNKHWQPGMAVNPPADLLVHHANWTVGVENKLRLLEEVRLEDERRRKAVAGGFVGYCTPNAEPPTPTSIRYDQFDSIENSERTMPYSEVTRLLDYQRRALTGGRHHPLPLALVLQFWRGDKRRALELAKLIADLEPAKRADEICFVFARQANCPMDDEIQETQLYVGQKFRFIDMEVTVDESKKYPGVCFDAWANACQQLSDAYHTGRLPYGNAFFFEADGCPIGSDWIDRIRRAHAETLLLGKRVTGPLMRFGGVDSVHQVGGHINGTMVMHLSCWDDHPSLRRCPPTAAWDVFHGLVLRNEAGPSQIIANHHGGRALSQEMYWEFGKEHAFVTSIKDGTPQHWCRLGMQLEREKQERQVRNG